LTPQAATQNVPQRQPEVGELVHVRSRRWLVDEVIEPKIAGQTSVVRLSCADDDAQGQSLEVLWDYELDRLILKEEGWADLAAKGFDQPRQFAAFLHTLRWNCVTATDPNLFQAPFRAGIKVDAYQMEPLRKALRLPRVNLFIADDTVLGKRDVVEDRFRLDRTELALPDGAHFKDAALTVDRRPIERLRTLPGLNALKEIG